jgi:hypothetical protein
MKFDENISMGGWEQNMIEIILDNWYPLLSLVITPIIIAIINKKTISFSSADDVIKLKEYKENKKNDKMLNKFYSKLYRICFKKQKKYKGWTLWDFNEFGDIEDRWFRVRNNDGEYITVNFPEHFIVRRYGYANDRLQHGHYCYKPSFIENIIFKAIDLYNKKTMKNYFPKLISFLEDKKNKNETIGFDEIYKYLKKVRYNLLEKMIIDLKEKKQRGDLTDLIKKNEIL